MIAKAETAETSDKSITLNFEHQLARVVFNLTAGGQYKSGGLATNYASYACLPTKEPDSRVSVGNNISIILCKYENGKKYIGVVPEGKYEAGKNFFNHTLVQEGIFDDLFVKVPNKAENEELYTLLCETGLKKGKSYTFNVIVGKNVMTIGSVTSTDWEGGTLGDGSGVADEKTTANASTHTVNVMAAGELTEALITAALDNGTELTLTGNVGEADLTTLQKYISTNSQTLTLLDLSGTTIESIPDNFAYTYNDGENNYEICSKFTG